MLQNLFTISAYRTKLNYQTDKIQEHLHQLHNDNKLTSQKNWNTPILTSHNVININEEYKDLMQNIAYHVGQYAEQLGYKVNKIFCRDAWFNYGLKNSYQEYHIHTGSHFSGVYFINVPEDCGTLVFKKNINMMEYPEIETPSEHNCGTVQILPKENELILFNSNLEHMVTQNITDTPRITMSFNFIIE